MLEILIAKMQLTRMPFIFNHFRFRNCWDIQWRCFSKADDTKGGLIRPKRPLNSYFKFCEKFKPQLEAMYPNITRAEINIKLGEKWAQMSEEERFEFKKDYKEEFLKYKAKLKEYENSLSEEQKQLHNDLTDSLKNSKMQKLLPPKSVLWEVLQKPKKPSGSFARFVKNQRSSSEGFISFKELSSQWKNLPQSDKEKLHEDSRKKMEQYLSDLKNWEIKMIEQGNHSLVRIKTIKAVKQKILDV